jgi:hypothetical protein
MKDWLTVIATIVIAIATAVNVFVVRGQLSEMKSSGGRTEKSIAAAQASAQAAKDAVSLAYSAERAYVFVESAGQNLIDWRSGKAQFEWRYRFCNHGKTPAIVTRIVAVASITDAIPPFTEAMRLDKQYIWAPITFIENEQIQPSFVIEGSNGASEIFVARGDHSPLIMSEVPSDIATQRLRLYEETTPPGRVNFWLQGAIDYKDIFGASHSTTFCLKVDKLTTHVVVGGNLPCNTLN